MSANDPIVLSNDQKEFLKKNSKDNPDLNWLVREVFNNQELDGRTKEGRAVRKFLTQIGSEYETTKTRLVGRQLELSDTQKEIIRELSLNGKNSLEIARIVFNEKASEIVPLSKETQVVAAYIKEASSGLVEEMYRFSPPKSLSRVIKKVNDYAGEDIIEEKINTRQKEALERMMKNLAAPRFVDGMNSYLCTDDRVLFEGEFVRSTWNKIDLTSDEINLYINICENYVFRREIKKQILKLNKMFDDIEGQNELTVRYSETLKQKSSELDQCESRIVKATTMLDGVRAQKQERRVKENASILSLVRAFMDHEERNNMLRLAEMQRAAVKDEAEKLENMEEWKVRILGISKEDAI